MKQMKKITFLTLAAITLFSCGNDTETGDEQDLLNDFAYADSLQKQVVISEEIIEEMIHSIPSPIEMTSLILSSGAKFDEHILNNPDNVEKYVSAHSKALNLGIYGAELGYLNIYEKTMVSVDYISAVRSLAKDLKVDHFFDFQTLKRLASSSDNIDSLINITTQGFSKMDAYLREQNRTKASVLIVTGTFIEGLHIATQIVSKTSNPKITERIGEQKMSLNNLILMLNVYKNDPDVAKLISDFNELKVLYDGVEIITVYGEPITKEVDGMLVIEDQSTSEVKISKETLEKIIMKTKELRNKII
ncbi:MAG: hypothetical protein A3K10_11920 [Bacteroidetes bacterium RIFCSPLOWO2_12_FULL_31_6]|nr:MAG: hypothetical protein A3K10_11920 [Bacteroidetes bacterium RIFCSPLOWO2_12_FULL_31_6]